MRYEQSYASTKRPFWLNACRQPPPIQDDKPATNPIQPTTPFYWLPLLMVCSNCGRKGRTVGVICSKRKKSTILMAQILHPFSILWRVATPCNNTTARKRRRNICATRYCCFDVSECSFVQEVVEFDAKIEVSTSSPIGTDDMIFLARPSSYTLKEPNTFLQRVIRRSCCTVSVLKRLIVAVISIIRNFSGTWVAPKVCFWYIKPRIEDWSC